jgi:hypothetical protein
MVATLELRSVMSSTYTAETAKRLILGGDAPSGMHVTGSLNLSGSKRLRRLPEDLTCASLDISDCDALTELPRGLRCQYLNAQNSRLTALPADLNVKFRLDLSNSLNLVRLPENLSVGSLILRECTALRELPEGLDTSFLDLTGCTRLERFPNRGRISIGHLVLRGCTRLQALPDWLERLAQVDLAGCERLERLPEGLRISSWVDVADTGITALPDASTPLRWRGVPVDARIAFQPATIRGHEILETENLELRRVKLERMGYERFIEEVDAQVLDRDRDAGGERKLLRVPFPGDEDFVAVWVICPSTARNYVLRVPPTIKTCRAAAAWLAGFDNPDDYAPAIEA